MKSSEFRNTDFSEYAAGAMADLPAEADRLVAAGDASTPYSADFVTKVAAADKDVQFDIKQKLKKIPDFGVAEFNRRLKEADRQLNPPDLSRIPAGPDTTTDTLQHMLNDHGNACRIRDLYGEDLRYCWDMDTWLVWDGMRWAISDIGQARQLAKQTMLEFLKMAVIARNEPCEKFARLSLNSKSITAMLTMLESDLPARAAELDTSPWLLNFINGTVDLRTADIKAHDRSDFITKLVHTRFDPAAKCPLWDVFINWTMLVASDADETAQDRARRMVGYLQRAFGYSITGSTAEKAVFIPFGPKGNNGKSTAVTVVRQLVSEYSTLIHPETVMTRQRESSAVQEDLAKLRGARFVQTSETEEGQKLSQGMLKRITQGMGDITATRKYEHPITFPETHTLWIDTNKRPDIRDAEDDATFKRLHPIPFMNIIEDADIDKSLPQKLKSQAEGILAWLVEGARLWYRDQSLNRPPEIEAAREEWRESSDQIAHFLEERTEPTEDRKINFNFETLSSLVYTCYSRWCDATGEKIKFPQKKFLEKILSHGYTARHAKAGSMIQGIKLSVSLSDDPHSEPGEPPFYSGS